MPKNVEKVPKTNPDFFIVNVPDKRFHSFVPRVSHIGHTISIADTEYTLYQRKELEFCFRISSAEKYAVDEIDNQFHRNSFPHLLIKRPGIRHRYRTRYPRTACFVIYPAETMKLFELADIDLSQPGYAFQLTPEIRSLLDELRHCESLIHEPGIPDRIDLVAIRLISSVILQNKKKAQHLPQHDAVREIASFMECHISEEIDFRKLAGERGMSLRNFFRRWREVYQDPPAHYLLVRRMEFAKRLLLRSNMDIALAAENTGFSSAGYFIQAFKRYYGVTPAAYRRQHIESSSDTGCSAKPSE